MILIYNLDDLRKVINKKKLIIYGAGKVSSVLVSYLHKEKLSANLYCITVSNRRENPNEILGVPVYSIDELDEDKKELEVVIATLEQNHDNILSALLLKGFKNIHGISNVLYLELRRYNPSYEAEILQYVNESKNLRYMFLYNYEWQRRILEKNWGGAATESIDFKEKYLNLIRGLDDKSIKTVIRILKRQEQIIKSQHGVLDIYTNEEKEKLRIIQDDFYALILKLADNMYSYKQYLLPCNCFSISVFYDKHGIEKIRNKIVVQGKTIIDVGGFIGDSILILEELKPKLIYSFEAIPENFRMMQKTMKMNNINNVVLENCALGNKSENVSIKVAESGMSSLDREGIDYKEELSVPMIRLDEYVNKNNVEDIGLIKVDIEGAEPYFLEGAEATIKKNKPILLLSIYHNIHDFFELKPMIEEWNLGYHFSIHKPIDGDITSEALLIAEVLS